MKKHYRQENDCLNCGATLQGHFCHVCGQENLQIKESFGHMMNHAISDYFHFDYQFFHTLKPLFFKPGKLTTEYMAGKRMQYLHPVKMYIFISLVYFLVLFSGGKEPITTQNVATKKDVTYNTPASISITGKDSTYQQYLTTQKNLPPDKRDGVIKQFFSKKTLTKDSTKTLMEDIKHNVPKMMFLLLPLFAFILKITFWRSRKFYVEHLIYSFHLHCFLFLFLTVILLTERNLPANWGTTISFLNFFSFLIIVWYVYRSLKVVYNRTRWVTIYKMFALTFSYFIIFCFCMLSLFVVTALLQ